MFLKNLLAETRELRVVYPYVEDRVPIHPARFGVKDDQRRGVPAL